MPKPQIHRLHRSVSASKLLAAIGKSLSDIKDEDELTDADLAADLGKTGDTAARYRTALADMPATTMLRAFQRWNGRFANPVLALIGAKLVMLDVGEASDRTSVTTLMRAVLAMQEALEDDGEIDDVELVQRRSLIEEAGRVIDKYRTRLSVRAA